MKKQKDAFSNSNRLENIPISDNCPRKLLKLKKKKKNPMKLTPIKSHDGAVLDTELLTEEQEEGKRLFKLEAEMNHMLEHFQDYAGKLNKRQEEYERRIEEMNNMNDIYRETLKEFVKEQEQRNMEVEAKNEELQKILKS